MWPGWAQDGREERGPEVGGPGRAEERLGGDHQRHDQEGDGWQVQQAGD